MPMHVCTDDMNVVKRMQGSKYVQSNLGSVFSEIKELLKTREVLFAGTPCQTTGLYRFINRKENLEKLHLLAVVCEGVPSAKLWKSYLKELEQDCGAAIIDVNMRSKVNGWLTQTFSYNYENGRRISIPFVLEPYCRAFVTGLSINETCVKCPCQFDDMVADIIIGDGWGCSSDLIKKSGNKGISAICVLSKKGCELFESVMPHLVVDSMKFDDFRSNHKVLFKNKDLDRNIRNDFFENLNVIDARKNINEHIGTRKHQKINQLLNKFGLYDSR